MGVLYSGLGWLSAMRDALTVVFELPAKEQPNFVFGKLRDLLTLALIGVVLLVSVALTGFVRAASPSDLLDWLGPRHRSWAGWSVLVTIVFGLAANMVLFFAMFRLLAEPHTPTPLAVVGRAARRRRLRGPQAGCRSTCSASTKDQPAFQAFGIALILLVWINYFSRVVLYAAAWAHTSRAARAQRVPEPAAPAQGPPSPSAATQHPLGPAGANGRPGWVAPFAAGGATALGAGRRTPPTLRKGPRMSLERRHGWLLLGIAAWNVLIWLTFAKNLSAAYAAGEDRPTGYWVAHTVLIVVDLVIAVVLARIGRRALKP